MNKIKKMPLSGSVDGYLIESDYQGIELDLGNKIIRPKPFIYHRNTLYVSTGVLIKIGRDSKITSKLITKDFYTKSASSWLRDEVEEYECGDALFIDYDQSDSEFNIKYEMLGRNGYDTVMDENLDKKEDNLFRLRTKQFLSTIMEYYDHPSAIFFNGICDEVYLSGDLNYLGNWFITELDELVRDFNLNIYLFLPSRPVVGNVYGDAINDYLRNLSSKESFSGIMRLFDISFGDTDDMLTFEYDNDRNVFVCKEG